MYWMVYYWTLLDGILLDGKLLGITHGIGSLLHCEADEVDIIDIVVQVFGAAGIDQRIYVEQNCVDFSSGRDEVVDERLVDTGSCRAALIGASTDSDLYKFHLKRGQLSNKGTSVAEGRAQLSTNT